MDAKLCTVNAELTRICKREDDLYHRYSVSIGLSDPAVWVLYGLYVEADRVTTQNDLVAAWFYPKQTVNYTVNALVQKGWVKLEQLPVARNRKAVLLTKEGRHACEEKILPLIRAEESSLRRMTAEERDLLLRLMRKQIDNFEEEIQKLIGEKSEDK